jgi:ABC-2 type transport system permease protein
MIRHIVSKEFREILRDGRFLWTGLIVAALLLTSMVVGWRQMEDASAMRRAATGETRQQWLNQGTKNPHAAQHYGVYAFKPATPLSFLDPGINDYAGNVTLLEAHKQNDFRYKAAQDATSLQRFGQLSAAMIMQLLIPLLIILLSFSAIAGEREEGTLRQVLSLGIDRSTFVIGKALGVAAALGVTLLPALLLGSAAIAFGGSAGLFDDHAMLDMPERILVLALGYTAYFSIFLMLALTVSILARSSRVALTVLLGIWILNGLLIPRAGSDLGRQIYPTVSAFQFARLVAQGKEGGVKPFDPTSPNHIAFVNKLFRQYHVKRIEDLPVNFLGLALQADEEHNYKVYGRLFGQMWDSFEAQNQLQQALAIVSPYLAIRSISSALAGTDFALHRDFATKAEAYRRQIGRVMNNAIAERAAGKSVFAADWQLRAGADLWSKVPPFDYDPPLLPSVLSKQVIALLMLALWLVGSTIALIAATKRMRIDA